MKVSEERLKIGLMIRLGWKKPAANSRGLQREEAGSIG